MPDARLPDAGPPGPALAIADALARLPLETPERSAWPRLAERLDAAAARRPRPRWPFALAAAAVVLAAVALPRLQPDAVPAADPAPLAVVADDARLPDLMRESARLEHVIAAVGDDQAGTASALVLGLQLEDELQQLDTALSQPSLAQADRLQLWQRRVDLLRDYAALQGTRQALAAEGVDLDGNLVAVF